MQRDIRRLKIFLSKYARLPPSEVWDLPMKEVNELAKTTSELMKEEDEEARRRRNDD